MRSFFFFMQGEKHRRCGASTRLFNMNEVVRGVAEKVDNLFNEVNRLRTGCQRK